MGSDLVHFMGITSAEIRSAIIARQGICGEPNWTSVYGAVRQLGAVQLDTIAVVARSHHLTLRHRVQGYNPEKLWTALQEGVLFEYLAHAACVIPIEDYPYYRPSMQRFQRNGPPYLLKLLKKHEKEVETVYQRIRNEGPLTSKDFRNQKKTAGWWDWKPAKIALDLLWRMGRISVKDRVGFQRRYELTEKVIPSKFLDRELDDDEEWRFFLNRVLDLLVVATQKELSGYFLFSNWSLNIPALNKGQLAKKLDILVKEGSAVPVNLEDSKQQHYTLSNYSECLEDFRDFTMPHSQALILTLFDNLLWNRARVKRLYGADVTLEAYIPKAKRKFGYYAMPILWNSQLIGQLDPKADYDNGILVLRNAQISLPKINKDAALEAIRSELAKFMSFHHLEELHIDKIKPKQLKQQLL